MFSNNNIYNYISVIFDPKFYLKFYFTKLYYWVLKLRLTLISTPWFWKIEKVMWYTFQLIFYSGLLIFLIVTHFNSYFLIFSYSFCADDIKSVNWCDYFLSCNCTIQTPFLTISLTYLKCMAKYLLGLCIL